MPGSFVRGSRHCPTRPRGYFIFDREITRRAMRVGCEFHRAPNTVRSNSCATGSG